MIIGPAYVHEMVFQIMDPHIGCDEDIDATSVGSSRGGTRKSHCDGG
jgi:hypothetical protein